MNKKIICLFFSFFLFTSLIKAEGEEPTPTPWGFDDISNYYYDLPAEYNMPSCEKVTKGGEDVLNLRLQLSKCVDGHSQDNPNIGCNKDWVAAYSEVAKVEDFPLLKFFSASSAAGTEENPITPLCYYDIQASTADKTNGADLLSFSKDYPGLLMLSNPDTERYANIKFKHLGPFIHCGVVEWRSNKYPLKLDIMGFENLPQVEDAVVNGEDDKKGDNFFTFLINVIKHFNIFEKSLESRESENIKDVSEELSKIGVSRETVCDDLTVPISKVNVSDKQEQEKGREYVILNDGSEILNFTTEEVCSMIGGAVEGAICKTVKGVGLVVEGNPKFKLRIDGFEQLVLPGGNKVLENTVETLEQINSPFEVRYGVNWGIKIDVTRMAFDLNSKVEPYSPGRAPDVEKDPDLVNSSFGSFITYNKLNYNPTYGNSFAKASNDAESQYYFPFLGRIPYYLERLATIHSNAIDPETAYKLTRQEFGSSGSSSMEYIINDTFKIADVEDRLKKLDEQQKDRMNVLGLSSEKETEVQKPQIYYCEDLSEDELEKQDCYGERQIDPVKDYLCSFGIGDYCEECEKLEPPTGTPTVGPTNDPSEPPGEIIVAGKISGDQVLGPFDPGSGSYQDLISNVSESFRVSHPGVDFAISGGTNIRAIADGEVIFVRNDVTYSCSSSDTVDCSIYNKPPYTSYDQYNAWWGGYGNVVGILHEDGVSVYAHLQTGSINVLVGDQVEAGQVIAKSDNTGNSTGNHLHFEMRKLNCTSYSTSCTLNNWDVSMLTNNPIVAIISVMPSRIPVTPIRPSTIIITTPPYVPSNSPSLGPTITATAKEDGDSDGDGNGDGKGSGKGDGNGSTTGTPTKPTIISTPAQPPGGGNESQPPGGVTPVVDPNDGSSSSNGGLRYCPNVTQINSKKEKEEGSFNFKDPSGRIYIGGDFDDYRGLKTKNLVRFNADGTLDTTFKVTEIDVEIKSIKIREDGKIVINDTIILNDDGSLFKEESTGDIPDYNGDCLFVVAANAINAIEERIAPEVIYAIAKKETNFNCSEEWKSWAKGGYIECTGNPNQLAFRTRNDVAWEGRINIGLCPVDVRGFTQFSAGGNGSESCASTFNSVIDNHAVEMRACLNAMGITEKATGNAYDELAGTDEFSRHRVGDGICATAILMAEYGKISKGSYLTTAEWRNLAGIGGQALEYGAGRYHGNCSLNYCSITRGYMENAMNSNILDLKNCFQ